MAESTAPDAAVDSSPRARHLLFVVATAATRENPLEALAMMTC